MSIFQMFSSFVDNCFETVIPFCFCGGREEELLAKVETEVTSSYGPAKYKVLSNVK